MTRRTVLYEEAVVMAMSRFLYDRPGLTEAMNAIDDLADNPRPDTAVPYGPALCRLHIGRYRAMYEITDTQIRIINLARTR